MSVNLPKSMEFVEYRPSMVGIPEQAVARYYDRLDQEALRTEAAANKVQQALGNHIATAPEGDKPYLQDLFGKIEGIMDSAQNEGNLPGYAKQIRRLVGDIAASPEYATVRNNSRLAEEWRKVDMQLATQYGRENIVQSGDTPDTFSSFGADGEMRQFQGFATRRPDYLKGMDDVFMRNVDIVATQGAMEQFVDNGTAFADYMKTPEGRVHINELSRSMTGMPFDRIPRNADGSLSEQGIGVVQQMNNVLKDAGVRYIKTKVDKGEVPDAVKHLKGKGIQSSGIAGVSLTDGTEAADSTIAVFDDRLDNTKLDNQLTNFVTSLHEITLYPDASQGQEKFNRGKTMQTSDIVSSRLTSAIGPNGLPLIQVEYNNRVAGDGSEQGMGYYEIPLENVPFLQQEMDETMYQLRNYSSAAAVGSMTPAIANIFDPTLNAWAMGKLKAEQNSAPHTVPGQNIQVQKVGNNFALYDAEGAPLVDPESGKHIVFGDTEKTKAINSLRNYIGSNYIYQ